MKLVFRIFARIGWAALLGMVCAAQVVQSARAQDRPIRFERISVDRGLSQSSVTSIFQDSLGFLWFGTDDGLNKYDGASFVVYRNNPEDPTSISHNTITAIYEDRSGQVWIGTSRGLNLLDRQAGRFSLFDPNPNSVRSLAGVAITALLEDRAGSLWIGTEIGLLRWDPAGKQLERFTRAADQAGSLWNDGVLTLYEDRAGALWIGTSNGGLDRLQPGSNTFEHFGHDSSNPGSPTGFGIRSILEDASGGLWLATCGSGLYRLDPTSAAYEHFPYVEGEASSPNDTCVRALMPGQNGEIWIATNNGLDLWDPIRRGSIGRYYHDPNDLTSLSSNQLASLVRDRSGVVWVGTLGGGLSKHSPYAQKFDLYRHSPNDRFSLLGNIVTTIQLDSQDRLWVGTADNGLNFLDPETGRFSHFQNNPASSTSVASSNIQAVVEDRDGFIWVATGDKGLDRLNLRSRRFEHFRHNPLDPDSLSSDQVASLHLDRSGRLWIGTLGGGLDRYDPITGTFEHYPVDRTPSNRLSDENIRVIYEDSGGRLWLATDNGFNIYNPAEDSVFRYSPNLADPLDIRNGQVLSFYEDTSGAMWIGATNGLHRYQPDTAQFQHINQNNGLPNDVVHCILGSGSGPFWLSTNRGLSRYDPASGVFRNYDITDGLQNNEFSTGACLLSPAGRYYFGGIGGVNSFVPAQVVDNPHPPPVIVTSFKKFNQTIRTDLFGQGEPVELSYRDNYISFEFAALDYTAPQKNQYAYKLEGFDSGWIDSGTRRFTSYTNLKGGDYTFRVRGTNNDGVWNEEGIAIRFTVLPPFWETWWFLAAALGLTLASIFGIYRARVHQIETRSQQLAAQVEQRTGELRQEIEQRRQTETALRLSEAQYRDLVENANSIIVRWDTRGRVLFFNRYAQEFFGYSEEQIIGRNILGSILPEKDESGRSMVDWLKDLFQHPSAYYTTENQNTLHDGRTVWIAWTNKAVYDSQGQLIEILSIGNDRTSQKEAERELSLQVEQAAIAAERSRLARDLHDAVSQTLFSTSLIAEVMPRLWERDPQEGYRRLDEIRQLTRGALAEMRTLLLELRPTALLDADAGELFRHLADAFTGRTRIPVELRLEAWNQDSPQLPPEVKLGFYRIAQEAFNNIAKHAAASRVCFSFGCQDGEVVLSIEDNGKGFRPGKVSPDHLGITIMRERAEGMSACFDLLTEPGQGTRITTRWSPEGETPQES